MAKPILVIRIPSQINTIEAIVEHCKNVQDKMEDYHIFPIFKDGGEIEFECYNDCKGLTDIDIKSLANKFYENNS